MIMGYVLLSVRKSCMYILHRRWRLSAVAVQKQLVLHRLLPLKKVHACVLRWRTGLPLSGVWLQRGWVILTSMLGRMR